jgi:hypothetical protein
VTVWNTRNLDVPDARHLLTEFHAEIALYDLRVIEVELNAKIWCSDFLANRLGLILTMHEISWHVAAIDRFD